MGRGGGHEVLFCQGATGNQEPVGEGVPVVFIMIIGPGKLSMLKGHIYENYGQQKLKLMGVKKKRRAYRWVGRKEGIYPGRVGGGMSMVKTPRMLFLRNYSL